MENVVFIRKESREVVWLLAGVWKLKGIRQNTDEERFPQCLGEKDVAGQIINYKLEKEMFKRRMEGHTKMCQHSSDKRIRQMLEQIQICIVEQD